MMTSLVEMVYVNKHVVMNMTSCTRRQSEGSSDSSSKKKTFVRAEEVFRSLTHLSRHLSEMK